MLYFHQMDRPWPGSCDKCFNFIKWTGQDEKKETVLDCYVPGARGETLINLVNSSTQSGKQ